MTGPAHAAPVLSVRGLVKRFGTTTVLDGVDLDVARGEVLVVIGASGSGKTTLLRCVNALVPYDAGSITLEGVEVAYTAPNSGVRRSDRALARIRADIGMVFQMFNLFPHLTVLDNVGFMPMRVTTTRNGSPRARTSRRKRPCSSVDVSPTPRPSSSIAVMRARSMGRAPSATRAVPRMSCPSASPASTNAESTQRSDIERRVGYGRMLSTRKGGPVPLN